MPSGVRDVIRILRCRDLEDVRNLSFLFLLSSSCDDIGSGDTVAGLVKLKLHEGVGCDVTPEGGMTVEKMDRY